MKTVTIGTMRDDGDLAILATLNNNDDHMSEKDFTELTQALCLTLANYTGKQLVVLERQDTPDYVDLEG